MRCSATINTANLSVKTKPQEVVHPLPEVPGSSCHQEIELISDKSFELALFFSRRRIRMKR
jgi:hypothetical protein